MRTIVIPCQYAPFIRYSLASARATCNSLDDGYHLEGFLAFCPEKAIIWSLLGSKSYTTVSILSNPWRSRLANFIVWSFR